MSVLQENFPRDDDEKRNSDIHFGLQDVKIENIRPFVHKNAEPMRSDPYIPDTGSRLQPVKMRNCQ